MNTWTSKRSCAAVGLVLSLAACSEGGEGLSFLSGEATDAPSRRNVALLSAEMQRGAMTLVPPDGFCIDKRGLKQDFAVLARCDSLGGRGGAQDAPLGMILVSLTPTEGRPDLPETLSALIPAETTVKSRRNTEDLALAHLDGTGPDGTDSLYWRGVAQVDQTLMALTAFAPDGGPFAEPGSGQRLESLVRRSHDATLAKAVAQKTPSAEAPEPERKGLGGFLSGLLD